MTTEEFCGRYKGDHMFDEGENACRCGRAFKNGPPRPNETDERIQRRLSMAYRQAMELSHDSAYVTIHVGQEIMRNLKARAEKAAHWPLGVPSHGLTFYGFPIIEEMAWATEEVRVRAEKTIN